MFLITPIVNAVQKVGFVSWDLSLTFMNLISPEAPKGTLIPPGHPGAGGVWPEFVPPKEGDSRCCCPGLNAMANHGMAETLVDYPEDRCQTPYGLGIIPRDGRKVSFTFVNQCIRDTFNYSATFCYYTPKYAADMLGRNYDKDTFDLEEMDRHNGIEHDASFTREDTHLQPDQSKVHLPLIKDLVECATGKDKDGKPLLTLADLSKFSSQRRVDSKAANPEYSMAKIHRLFASNNATTLLTIFGGRVDDLETFFSEERIPDGWESRILKRRGVTMTKFNWIAFKLERGIDESKVVPKRLKDDPTPSASEVDVTTDV
ncbi:hypothetical protein BD779DRAFT_1672126 [Infundibulicybe gibba]|nr:hypothetical protein BD779DRAFT_1672126 [Infundibulicybe gibba]